MEISTAVSYIYGLKQGHAGSIRYIGRTRHPQMRRDRHLAKPSPLIREWLESFKSDSELFMEILETVDDDQATERERFYIQKYVDTDSSLLNCMGRPDSPDFLSEDAAVLITQFHWRCQCTRCGNQWTTLTDQVPKVCPKCKALTWNKSAQKPKTTAR